MSAVAAADDPLAPGEPRPSWGLGEVGAGIFASLFLSTVIGALIIDIGGWTRTADIPIWAQALLQIPLWGGYVGAVVFAARLKGNGVRADFGFSARALDAPVGLAIGVVTQLVLLPLLYLPILQLTGTDSDELSRPARELADRATSPFAWLIFALIVGLGAPVVEELFYRGLFLRALHKHGFGAVASVLISSAVFAAIHFQVLQFPGLMLFGLIAGTLAARTGRLGPSIWAHVGFNMTAVIALYLSS